MSRPRAKKKKNTVRRRRERPENGNTWKRWVPIVMACVFLAGGVIRFDPLPSVIGDNAQFLILGQSIAAGKGMTQLNEPVPVPHTKYPPFFPLVLAAVQLAFPFSFVAPKVVVLLFGTAAIYLFSALMIRRFSPFLAIPAALLAAIHPELLQFSHQILSEVPYLLLTAVALVLYDRWERQGNILVLAGALVAAAAAYYTRSIGVALVMAMVVSELFARRYRHGAVLLAAFMLLALPWAVRNKMVGTGESYVRQFLAVYPYEPARGTLSPTKFVTIRMKGNVDRYSTVEVGKGICADVLPDEGKLPGAYWMTLSILSTLLLSGGLAHRLFRERSVIEIYTFFYLGICLLWPEVWASVRFLLPVLPLLFFYVLHALHVLARPLLRRRSRLLPIVAAALFSMPALHANFVLARQPNAYPPNWANYFRAAAWVKENTPEDAIVACRKPYLFYLFSQRRSEGYLWSYDRDKVFRQFLDHGVEYVVVSQLSRTERKYLIPTLEQYADRVEVVKQYEDPVTLVTRLVREEGR